MKADILEQIWFTILKLHADLKKEVKIFQNP